MDFEDPPLRSTTTTDGGPKGGARGWQELSPIAFVVLRAGFQDSATLRAELAQAVVDAVGAIARPARVLVLPTVPRTRSGKIMRRLLRDLVRTTMP